jgi:hypothetical protein
MKETKLQVQKIINLQNIANNLRNTFTDYKGVTKSWNPMVNAPKRWRYLRKSLRPLYSEEGEGSSNQEG